MDGAYWRRAAKCALWGLAALLLALALVRAFVGDVYYVDSGSMEPTLHGAPAGGDWVFVRYERDPRPERFELLVLARAGDPDPLVKRVAGLPGETVQVGAGDLFVGGERPDPLGARPPWIELFDARRDDFATDFDLARDLWTRTGSDWRVEARGEETLATWRGRVLDGYRRADGERAPGSRQVGDLRIECELSIDAPWKRFALRLSDEGDVFELVLEPTADGRSTARLLRSAGNGAEPELLAETALAFSADGWHVLALANVDGEILLDLDKRRGVLRSRYGANTPLANAPDPAARHRQPRIALAGADLRATFRRIAVARDVHYTDLGERGTQRSETLAPDELFVLGDNSAESADSREWGPIRLADVVGRPVCVVWPPARWRWLDSSAAPPGP